MSDGVASRMKVTEPRELMLVTSGTTDHRNGTKKGREISTPADRRFCFEAKDADGVCNKDRGVEDSSSGKATHGGMA